MNPPRCKDCRSQTPAFGLCPECSARRRFLARLHRTAGKGLWDRTEIGLRAERVEVYRAKVERGEKLFE